MYIKNIHITNLLAFSFRDNEFLKGEIINGNQYFLNTFQCYTDHLKLKSKINGHRSLYRIDST